MYNVIFTMVYKITYLLQDELYMLIEKKKKKKTTLSGAQVNHI